MKRTARREDTVLVSHVVFLSNHLLLERQWKYIIFIMPSRDVAHWDQLKAFIYLFSFRITVSVSEEQLKWILIMKQKKK